MNITLTQLRSIFPRCSIIKLTVYHPLILKAMEEFDINTVPRVQMFLSQLGHESGGLIYFEELASGAAYEGRKDLGNIFKGDGVRFKGRGPIQLTGRANYEKYGKILDLPLILYPELAAKPENGFRLAAAFWKSKGLNELADKGDFLTITKKINGGTNGLSDRQKYLETCQRVITSVS